MAGCVKPPPCANADTAKTAGFGRRQKKSIDCFRSGSGHCFSLSVMPGSPVGSCRVWKSHPVSIALCMQNSVPISCFSPLNVVVELFLF